MAYLHDHDDEEALPSKEAVQARVDRWQDRLSNLYSRIEGWLPTDGSIYSSKVTRQLMNEPLMRAVGVPLTSLKTLTLFESPSTPQSGPGRVLVNFIPEGLWVIGTNGRVMVSTRKGNLYLVDAGTDEAPNWMIYPRRDWLKRVPFTQDELNVILAESHEQI